MTIQKHDGDTSGGTDEEVMREMRGVLSREEKMDGDVGGEGPDRGEPAKEG